MGTSSMHRWVRLALVVSTLGLGAGSQAEGTRDGSKLGGAECSKCDPIHAKVLQLKEELLKHAEVLEQGTAPKEEQEAQLVKIEEELEAMGPLLAELLDEAHKAGSNMWVEIGNGLTVDVKAIQQALAELCKKLQENDAEGVKKAAEEAEAAGEKMAGEKEHAKQEAEGSEPAKEGETEDGQESKSGDAEPHR